MKYTNILNRRKTPQALPIPGSGQVANSAGGHTWAVDDWKRLARFLVLGAEGGSYYASEHKLSVQNAQAVARCIASDGVRTVREIVAISDAGRALKNDPALFALAMCAGLGDDATRKAALQALPRVARIGTHLFHFAEYVEGFRGWGRGLRQAVATWYNEMPASRLAEQVIKYRQRDGWSHRDLLRLAHPQTDDETRNILYNWVVKGWPGVGTEPHPNEVLRTLWAFERVQRAETEAEAAALVREYHLPLEAVPSEKQGRAVWEALLPHAGLTFLIRNLGNLSKAGILRKGAYSDITLVAERITNQEALQKARVHPIQLLAALTTYRSGQGVRGGNRWDVVPDIVDALDSAFYRAFANVTPTGKRWVLALDVSGSMSMGQIAGIPNLTPRVGSAAMAMVTYRVEQSVSVIAFCDKIVPISLSRKQRLDDVVNAVSMLPFGRTDCAQPMRWALQNRVEADTFVIYTDNETWYGDIHPAQALREYRQKMGIDARLVVVSMVANPFSIADPMDAGMLDVVGFDTATPELIGQFALGNI